MKTVALSYHDAVSGREFDKSGFISKGAYVYKLDIANLENHFHAIAALRGNKPSNIYHLLEKVDATDVPFFITFDDGGISAATYIAPLLEKFGWIGHFFVTGACINTERFLSSQQVRNLHRRGHVIGSHSWSHPERMSKCPWDELVYEWRMSVTKMSEILEDQVRVASVPGGYFSRNVARAASAVGIRALFTSEPVKTTYHIGNCLILGRYPLQRDDGPAECRALATNHTSFAQAKKYISWNTKKLVKAIAGESYTSIRGHILARRQHA